MRRSLSVDLIQTLFVACLVVTGLAIAPDAQEPGNPYTTLVDVRMGQRFFRAQCGRCHGRDARGNDETAAPDLTTGRFQHAGNDAGIFRVIRNGIDGTAMIGINPNATESDRLADRCVPVLAARGPGERRSTRERDGRAASVQRERELRELPHGQRSRGPARP